MGLILMKNETSCSDRYVLPVAAPYLLYSPLRRVSALVNQKAVSFLKNSFETTVDNREIPDLLQDLFQELWQPVQIPSPERTGPLQPVFLGILPTRACNLACVYCDFGASNALTSCMDFQTATAAVDWMAGYVKSLGWNTLNIHFFGGEPFFAGDVVDVVVHRARAVASRLGLLPHFEVTTNGVFDEERARFVAEYFDTVVLSFDGFKEIHDRHRPCHNTLGSFDIVARTAQILSQSSVELCFRLCVTQESVFQLEQIAQWFCETFQPSVINVETLQPTPESDAAGLNPPNPYDFAVHYVKANRIVEGFGIKAIYASTSTDVPRQSFCPVGKDALIVSPDGRVSGCYLPPHEWKKRGLNFDVGRLSPDGTMQVDDAAITRLRRIVTEKPRCERCFCRWTCAGGCHVNHSYPGCSSKYNNFCIQTRIITACLHLKDLGFEQVADTLLDSRTAMESLALQPSDRLEDWEESHV